MFFIRDKRKLKFHIFFWVTCIIRIITGSMDIIISIMPKASYYVMDTPSMAIGIELMIIGILFAIVFTLRKLTTTAWVLVMTFCGTMILYMIGQIVYFNYYGALSSYILGSCVGPILFYSFVIFYYVRRIKLFSDRKESFFGKQYDQKNNRNEYELTQAVYTWCYNNSSNSVQKDSDAVMDIAKKIVDKTKEILVGRNFTLCQLLINDPQIVKEDELRKVRMDLVYDKPENVNNVNFMNNNSTNKIKYCRFCGWEISSDNVKFCRTCGKQIGVLVQEAKKADLESVVSPIKNKVKEIIPEKKDVGYIPEAEQLRKLKHLQDEGLITQEDYDAKKKQILGI